jgi:hypothetical protein
VGAASDIGKKVGAHTYLHLSAVERGFGCEESYKKALALLQATGWSARYNVVRLNLDATEVALLHYPGFFVEAFPRLLESWRIDIENGVVGYRTYESSLNPPILHRKELLLAADDPRRRNTRHSPRQPKWSVSLMSRRG